jgi:flagellar hook-associated protein 2
MAFDLLTTSGINSLVNYFVNNESQKRIAPLQTRKTKYTSISNIYSSLLTKVDALKTKMSVLKATGTSSAFATKKATSSNTNAVTVSASSTAQNGAFALRVNQLAKNDLVVSLDKNSAEFSSITTPGTYTFAIKGGDGEGGQFSSNVSVALVAGDFTDGHISFEDLSAVVTKAINNDKAVVQSNSVSGSTLSSGSFTFNLNGTETTINYSAGSYENVIDSIVTQLEDVSGLTAEKVVDGSNFRLKLTVTDSSKYVSISGDTGTLVSELGISVNKEKGASGIVSATSFSPSSGLAQISLTAKNSGSGFKIENLSDISGGMLNQFGLNLGSTRTVFVQNTSGVDTAGYVHSLSLLNSKITFNGLSIERNSNSITDLAAGVTLNLKSVMASADNDVTVDVANDVSAVKSKIDEFITSFNDVYNYIKINTSSSNGIRGILLGDSSGSSLLNLLSTTAYSSVSGLGSGTINSLSEMGITFNSNTGLSITDSAQLNDVLENNIEEVEQTFNSDSGIAANLYNKLLPYTGYNGYLTNRKNTFDDGIKSMGDSITKIQAKIEKDSGVLRNRYIQLQSQLSTLLSSTGSFGADLFS